MNPRFTFLSRLPVGFYLLFLLVMGAVLRFIGIEWDSHYHLHPDERFMSMVANAIKMPATWGEYFSPSYSKLSPYNTEYTNYLYGQLPLVFTKALAVATGRDGFEQLYLLGRAINATLDCIAILLIFVLARAIAPQNQAKVAGLCAAAAYTFCVLPIQNAHFFTVDTPLTFWTLVASLGAALLVLSQNQKQTFGALALCVVGLSFSIACKVSGIFVALPIGLAFMWRWKFWKLAGLGKVAVACVMMSIATATLFRVVSPAFFEDDSWLNWQPNIQFLNSLEQQSAFVRGIAMMPPQYQWFLSTPILGPAKNIFIWSTGPFLGATMLAGFWLCFIDLCKRRGEIEKRIAAGILLVFFGAVFLYVGSRFVHSIRYLLPLLPIGCVFAGLALSHFWYYVPLKRRFKWSISWRWSVPIVLVPTFLYAIAFASIYTRTTTRAQANEWFFANYPHGSSIAVEYWDDSLPVGYDPRVAQFHMKQLGVFDADNPNKIDALYDVLSTCDLYVLSSPRAWNTIGRLPSRYPLMTEFYRLLWNGDLGWEKAVTITSWPQLGPIEIPTLNAEEAFMVYDHPPVTVFRKKKQLSRQQFRQLFDYVNYGDIEK